jgi:hypothetical protein
MLGNLLYFFFFNTFFQDRLAICLSSLVVTASTSYIRELNQDRTLFFFFLFFFSARLYWELLYIFPFEGLVVLVLLHRRAPSDSVASQQPSASGGHITCHIIPKLVCRDLKKKSVPPWQYQMLKERRERNINTRDSRESPTTTIYIRRRIKKTMEKFRIHDRIRALYMYGFTHAIELLGELLFLLEALDWRALFIRLALAQSVIGGSC